MFGHLVSANLRFTQAWHFQFTAGGDTGAIMADSVIHSLHFNPSLNDSDRSPIPSTPDRPSLLPTIKIRRKKGWVRERGHRRLPFPRGGMWARWEDGINWIPSVRAGGQAGRAHGLLCSTAEGKTRRMHSGESV